MIKNGIVTGLYAFYLHGLINIEPDIIDFAFKRNNKTKLENELYTFSKKTKLISHIENYWEYGVIEKNEFKVYNIERLIITINTFNFDKTTTDKIIDKVFKENIISYKTITNTLKKLKSLNSKLKIPSLLLAKLSEIKKAKDTNLEKLLNPSYNLSDVIRDHLLKKLNKVEDVFILKGGSAVQFLLGNTVKRATYDGDVNVAPNINIDNLKKCLAERDESIWFDLTENNIKEMILKIEQSKIFKFNLSIKTKNEKIRNRIKNMLGPDTNKNIYMPVSFNFNFETNELIKTIKAFNLTKRPLRYLNGETIYIFSREMIIAEKTVSIVNNFKNTTKFKDVYDCYKLNDQKIDWNKVINWVEKKLIRNTRSNIKDLETYINKCKEVLELDWNRIEIGLKNLPKLYGDDINEKELVKVYKEIISKIIKVYKK